VVAIIISAISTFCLVMCGCQFLLSLLQSTTLIVAQRIHVDAASGKDNIKVSDQCICCDRGSRETSFIAGTMALHCNDEQLQLAQSILL
jgi:hypothetical protein